MGKETKKQRQEYQRTCKLLVIQKYGGKCRYCKETDLACLSIDHINNDGNKERNRYCSRKFYYELRINEKRSDLQVLCFNCQWRKRIYGNEFETWTIQRIDSHQKPRRIGSYTIKKQ